LYTYYPWLESSIEDQFKPAFLVFENDICDIFTNTMFQMQTLTRMDKGVIKDYCHMTTIDECELNETNTSIVSFSSKP